MEEQPMQTPTEIETSSERELAPLAFETSPERVPVPSAAEITFEREMALPAPEASPEREFVSSAAEAPLGRELVSIVPETASEREMAFAAPGSTLERVPGYLSVREAASIMGVSERSVYGYIEAGKLPGARIGNIIVVISEYVYTYERRAPGRTRTTTPPWHMPPLKNLQYLTTITARMYPGQGELLEHKLHEMRVANKHRLLGTAARYIARNQSDPEEIEIVLVWRSVVMPPPEVREASLAAFYADLADVINWETATRTEGQVLMHA